LDGQRGTTTTDKVNLLPGSFKLGTSQMKVSPITTVVTHMVLWKISLISSDYTNTCPLDNPGKMVYVNI